MDVSIYMDRKTEAQAWKELQKFNADGNNATMQQYIGWLIEETMRQRAAAEQPATRPGPEDDEVPVCESCQVKEATHDLDGEALCYACYRWETERIW